MPDWDQPAADIDRVAQSLRSEPLRALYAVWRSAWHGLLLPRPEDLPLESLPAHDDVALVAVEPGTNPACFRFVEVGAGLEEKAGRTLLDERIGITETEAGFDPLGGATWAYRRALASASPSYEFAYFRFGGDLPLLFERLILPLGRGLRASHLLIVARFSEAADEMT